MFSSTAKMYVYVITLSVVPKYILKSTPSKILSTGRNVLEFFCVFPYTDYRYDLLKKFQAASTCNTTQNAKFGVPAKIYQGTRKRSTPPRKNS